MESLQIKRIDPIPEKQRAALVSLLADEDAAVYETIRAKLLSFGPRVADWLRPQLLSSDPLMRRRSGEIIDYFARRAADESFLEFCARSGEDLNLEQALGLLSQTRYPGSNLEAYHAMLDQWSVEVYERIGARTEPDVVLGIINRYLFQDLGFHGDDGRNLNAAGNYLNRIVDTRSGSPCGLCALYLVIARRLGLPIVGINLPGYFLCRYQTATREIFLDVFQRGKFWTKGDCIKFLQSTQLSVHEGRLSPASSRRVLARVCDSLHQTYCQLEVRDEARRLQRYLMALAK